MRLRFLQLDISLPKEVLGDQLRPWLLAELEKHGEPLRWCISGVEELFDNDRLCKLRVEAVVIIENLSTTDKE